MDRIEWRPWRRLPRLVAPNRQGRATRESEVARRSSSRMTDVPAMEYILRATFYT